MFLSLFEITNSLSDLMEARQELLDETILTEDQKTENAEALEQVDLAIVEYVTKEIRKVDNIGRFILECNARSSAIAEEVTRLTKIRHRTMSIADRIREMVLQIMRDTGVKKLEGEIATLRRQANGGVQPVEIVQPELVPDKFKRITISFCPDDWQRFVEMHGDRDSAEGRILKRAAIESLPTLNKELIREALEAGEGVMGARLAPRGEHLRVF